VDTAAPADDARKRLRLIVLPPDPRVSSVIVFSYQMRFNMRHRSRCCAGPFAGGAATAGSVDRSLVPSLYLNNPSVRYSHLENAAPPVPQRLKPRKIPSQSRSGATVEAIHEAVIQVLLGEGLTRFTTIRVAERAGISIGTLYQYFPNKEALLFAILLRHFEEMAEAIERLPVEGSGRSLDEIAHGIADAYVSVKTARPDATTALYRVAGAIDQVRLSTGIYKRLEAAVVRVLAMAVDAAFKDHERVAFTLLSALAGMSRGAFGNLVSGPDILTTLQEDARLLASAYLRAAAEAGR
jgi:AcrR family transcriptional regulator